MPLNETRTSPASSAALFATVWKRPKHVRAPAAGVSTSTRPSKTQNRKRVTVGISGPILPNNIRRIVGELLSAHSIGLHCTKVVSTTVGREYFVAQVELSVPPSISSADLAKIMTAVQDKFGFCAGNICSANGQ